MLRTSHPNPALAALRVVDAMHPGLITCRPEEPIRSVARLMSTYRVHAVFVTEHRAKEDDRWGVISDVALLRASEAGALDQVTAREIAATPVLSVAPSDDLGAVAQLMVEREISHVVVVEGHSRRPLGVLSTLDLAGALAGFPGTHPLRN